ncbi:hypothetical protein LTR95_007904 [Oleoguttula sp. CCFEE 5521]
METDGLESQLAADVPLVQALSKIAMLEIQFGGGDAPIEVLRSACQVVTADAETTVRSIMTSKAYVDFINKQDTISMLSYLTTDHRSLLQRTSLKRTQPARDCEEAILKTEKFHSTMMKIFEATIGLSDSVGSTEEASCIVFLVENLVYVGQRIYAAREQGEGDKTPAPVLPQIKALRLSD